MNNYRHQIGETVTSVANGERGKVVDITEDENGTVIYEVKTPNVAGEVFGATTQYWAEDEIRG
jgi:hypothetical protein